MKIVMAPIGSRGDVQPLLALARALKAAGHEVLLCAAPDYRGWAEAESLAFLPAGPAFEPLLVELAGVLTRHPIKLMSSLAHVIDEIFEAHFTKVRAACADADLLLGAGFHLVGSSVAEAAGVPYRFVIFCPILLPSEHYPAFIFKHRKWPAVLNRWSWRVMRWVFDRIFKQTLNKHRARVGLAPVNEVYGHNLQGCGEALVAWDRLLAPVPPDVPIPVVQTPAWILPSQEGSLPPDVEAFLQAGPPPVYVGFGSMTDPHPAETTRRVVEAVRQVGARVVLSRGWARLGEGVQAPDVLVMGSVPHELLFPRMAALVHHGGAGTTSAAVRSGVPQVIVPHLGDQFYIGHIIWELGVGAEPIFKEALTVPKLVKALQRVLHEPTLRMRAQALGQALVGQNGAPEAVAYLERVVAQRQAQKPE